VSKFIKAESGQAFLKLGLYGKTGSGKTFTALLIAEGLAAREKKRIAFVDTEHGSDFYSMEIPQRTVHPKAFDFDRLVTRSLMETVEAVASLDTNEHGVLILDSITHLWEAAKAAYTGRLTSIGAIPIQAWGPIKKPYHKLITLFRDGNFHAIVCGREGVEMGKDDEGEPEVVGTRMKSEGETPYEPHILGRMVPDRDEAGNYIIRVFFEKDRSGILIGRTIEWPNYKTIEPVVAHLLGGIQGRLGTPDEVAERDQAAIERQREIEDAERQSLFQQIKDALTGAKNVTALKSAWDLTKGKKGRLGDELIEQLESAKNARKQEIMGAEGV